MKLTKLNDVPLQVLTRGVDRVKNYALRVLEFDSNWELIKETKNSNPSINCIAVIGPTPRGQAVLIEIGKAWSTPYHRTSKAPSRTIQVDHRYKFADVEIDISKIVLPICITINKLAHEQISAWTGWKDGGLGIVKTKSYGRMGIMSYNTHHRPEQDGIIFRVAAVDNWLIDIFLEAELLLNERLQKLLRGTLGLISKISSHRLSKANTIELLDSSNLHLFLKSDRYLQLLLTYNKGSRMKLNSPESFINFLFDNGYIDQDRKWRLMNFYQEFKSDQVEILKARKLRSQELKVITDNIQVKFERVRELRINDRINGNKLHPFYNFKVYDNVSKENKDNNLSINDEEEVI